MKQKEADIGLVGLGVMGQNLALNMADHGFGVAGLDRNQEKAQALSDADTRGFLGATTEPAEMVAMLKKPRAVLMLVPAGKPVDAVIDELKNILEPGDLIIDAGNSHFIDTNRHVEELATQKLHFLGVGVSGGADGARRGPSMMPGGPRDAYERVRPIFEATAARVDEEPCVTYLGPGSAGHYVKMVHNGIEYALMQLIAEAYDVMKRAGQMSNDALADTFAQWNDGPMNSFLIEITANILRVNDTETKQRLVDVILDAARQKGTGKWTSQGAMELQVPVPTIDAAVSMRDLSGYKQERKQAARSLPLSEHRSNLNTGDLVQAVGQALRFGMIAAYAQGMAQLKAASEHYAYGLSLESVARIWRGGCIIRAAMLNDIRDVFREHPDAANILVEKPFADTMKDHRAALVETLHIAYNYEIAVPGLASALAYFDGYRTVRLPANLIQAQRDYFGSHTYERIDREGTFHTEWR